MKNKSSDGINSMLAMIILAILAMPIFGIYTVTHSAKEDDKTLGIVMFVLGIIIWFVTGIIGS